MRAASTTKCIYNYFSHDNQTTVAMKAFELLEHSPIPDYGYEIYHVFVEANPFFFL